MLLQNMQAHFIFQIRHKPKRGDKRIPIQMTRIGKITHLKGELRSHPASYLKRGKITKEVIQRVSNLYYKNLRKTPAPELTAGNIKRSLTKNILKVISCKINKSHRLHDDVMVKMMLTQKITKDTDLSYYICPGYVQHLQDAKTG